MYRWLFMLLIVSRCSAQDAAPLLNRGGQLEAAFREEDALAIYKRVLVAQPHQLVALCRCSDLSCRVGNREADREKKIALFRAGYQYAQQAYKLDSTNSETNIAMAFSLARMALNQSGKQRVQDARDIKRFAEQALRSDAANYKAWHILGRWNYEVSDLSAIERTLARWFFGALPEASLDIAVKDYQKSMQLKPNFLLNYYELARAYRREGRKAAAIDLLTRMDKLPDGMYDDREVRRQARKLLAELR